MSWAPPLIVGWVGRGDFGDEAMAYGLRTCLAPHCLAPPTYYQSGEEARYHAPGEAATRVLHPSGRPARLRALLDRWYLRRYPTLLIGGGSVFHSSNSIGWKHELARRVRSRHGERALIACVGVSAGPFTSAAAERAFGTFLQDVDVFISRDSHGAQAAQAAGSTAQVWDAADLSLLAPVLAASTPGARRDGPVGMAFVQQAGQSGALTERRTGMFQEIVSQVRAAGREVELFVLHTGEEMEDRQLAERLAAAHPSGVRVHAFDGDVPRTAAAIASCVGFLSMRLHGAIFAYRSGVPFVSLGYDPKNRHFCASVGYPPERVFDVDDDPAPAELAARLLDAASPSAPPLPRLVPPDQAAQRIDAALQRLWAMRAAR